MRTNAKNVVCRFLALSESKEFKIALTRFNTAQKASRDVTVPEAKQTKRSTAEFFEELRSEGPLKAPPLSQIHQALANFHRQLAANLKSLSKITLHADTHVGNDVLQHVGMFNNIPLNSTKWDEVLGTALVISHTAHFVFLKANRAAEMTHFYGSWLDIYKTKGRPPSFEEQMSIKKEYPQV